MSAGIAGTLAPALAVDRWIDGGGQPCEPICLDDLGEGFRLLFFFQHWCRGCHALGFPALKRLVEALGGLGVGFAAVQTVFGGADVNTADRLEEAQRNYGLAIPFGHAAPASGGAIPAILTDYAAGGTPWFIVIASDGRVALNGFLPDTDLLIDALRPLSVG